MEICISYFNFRFDVFSDIAFCLNVPFLTPTELYFKVVFCYIKGDYGQIGFQPCLQNSGFVQEQHMCIHKTLQGVYIGKLIGQVNWCTYDLLKRILSKLQVNDSQKSKHILFLLYQTDAFAVFSFIVASLLRACHILFELLCFVCIIM